MEHRILKSLSLYAGILLIVAMVEGCGGGGSSSTTTQSSTGSTNSTGSTTNTGTAANANTTAFTSALMNGGAFYLDGYTSKFQGGKVFHASGSATQQVLDGGTYSFNPLGTATTWTSSPTAGYFLNGTGVWQTFNASSTMIDNGDGSYTVDGVVRLAIASVTELAGQSPACISASGANAACTTAKTYATGAKKYAVSVTTPVDQYYLNYQVTVLTDLNGVALTALPTAGGAGYCAESSAGKYVYKLVGQTYDRYTTLSCTPTGIASALLGTPLTGITLASGGRNGATVGLLYKQANASPKDIIAKVNGTFWAGYYYAASSTPTARIYYNRTAFDTIMAAQGLPAFP